MGSLQKHLRNTMLAGVFAAVPLAVTIFAIVYVETTTRELVRKLLGWNIVFVGVVVAIVAIYLLGLLVTSLVGKWLLGRLDRLIMRLPVLKDLYQAWKQVSLTAGGKGGMFAQVVLIPSPTASQRALAFTSGEPLEGDADTCCVFVPATPNPVSGRLVFLPRRDCLVLDLSTEEAFKIIISGGNYIPAQIGRGTAQLAGSHGRAGDQPSA
jgi:uncharacterized membrane protein